MKFTAATVKGYERAISSVWDLTSEAICTSNVITMKLEKESRTSNPNKPKYDSTFDIRPILNYIIEIFKSKKPVDVCCRLILLLRTQALRRSSDIAYIVAGSVDLENLSFSQSRTKNDPNPTGPIFFEENISNPALCLRRALQDYIQIFGDTFAKKPDGPLLIALNGGQGISSATIGKIVFEAMGQVGIDTKVFKSHSLRMASASALLDAGMSIEQVMKLGSWKSSQVFLKFYHRARVTGSVNAINSINGPAGRTRGGRSQTR